MTWGPPYNLSVRKLAEKAGLSPAQVSRIERGMVEQPSIDTLAAIAKALDRNPIPLWIVARHVEGLDALELLREMLSPDAEIFDEWGDVSERDSALELISDPSPDAERVRELAAKVFKTFETEETLWDTYVHRLSREPYASSGLGSIVHHLRTSRQSQALLEVARHLPHSRLAKVVEYARDQFEAEFGRASLGTDADLDPGEEKSTMETMLAEDPEEEPGQGPFTRIFLEREGFEGFLTIAELRKGRITEVPSVPGAYVVLKTGHADEFLEVNPGGHFKRRDPSVSLGLLKAKWIEASDTVYVGKGNDLRRRIKQFVDFGAGKPVGHWGGRYIWQLARADALVIAWVRAPEGVEAREVETELLDRFAAEFGGLPFANLTR